MPDNDTQPVADETDVQASATEAKPGTEETGARTEDEELDSLLAQYETSAGNGPSSTQPDTTTKTADGETVDERVERLEREAEERRNLDAQQRFEAEIGPIVQKVRGDIPAELYDDDDVRDWIERQARKDPRIANAWRQRQTNPTGFNKIVDGLGRQLNKRFKNAPDAKLTEDREAVAAAVRGSSTRAPEGQQPDFGGLSNGQFADDVKKLYGFTPPV